MRKPIHSVDYNKLMEILDNFDQRADFYRVNMVHDETGLRKELQNHICLHEFTTKSVLGIDIYKYNSYPDFEQTLIPIIFKIMLDATIELCLSSQIFIFQNYTKNDIMKKFIDTGDGGFFIFDSPLHSVVFAIYFQIIRRIYNSYHLYPRLRKIIGHISLRYAITYDTIYQFNNNHYGRSIINNSRILNKDNLNRCLIDQGTHEWFLIHLDGVENLQVISMKEIANIYDYQDYDTDCIHEGNSLFCQNHTRNSGIINADISKIGTIISKNTPLDVYNLHIQVTTQMTNTNIQNEQPRKITISLGNLNTSGI